MYRVLKPHYEKTGDVTQTPEGPMRWHRVIWVDVGTAESLEDAKAKFGAGLKHGRAPVLEWIGRFLQ